MAVGRILSEVILRAYFNNNSKILVGWENADIAGWGWEQGVGDMVRGVVSQREEGKRKYGRGNDVIDGFVFFSWVREYVHWGSFLYFMYLAMG